MAYSRSHINTNGSFNTGQKSSLLKTFDELQTEIDAAGGSFTPTAAPTALTNNTGGTANDTLVAIPNTTPADLAAQGTINGNIRDNLADLAVKVNALRTALIASGILT